MNTLKIKLQKFSFMLLAVLVLLAGFQTAAYSEGMGAAGKGIDVLPQTVTFTGSSSYSVPIEVPPGRGKVTPGLALTYNSYAKNSWVGVGWDLDFRLYPAFDKIRCRLRS